MTFLKRLFGRRDSNDIVVAFRAALGRPDSSGTRRGPGRSGSNSRQAARQLAHRDVQQGRQLPEVPAPAAGSWRRAGRPPRRAGPPE